MAAGVDDYEIQAERTRGDKLAREGLRRAPAQPFVWRSEVYEVFGVRDYGRDPEPAPFLCESFGVRARLRDGPALRVGDEDLDRLAPELAGSFEGFPESTGGREVASDPVRPCGHGGDSNRATRRERYNLSNLR